MNEVRANLSARAPWRGRTELELLLCLARAHLTPADALRLETLLQRPIDWDDFLRLAHRHRLLPLCARHLNRLTPELVPATTMQTMHRYAEQNVRRSLLLTGELRTLLRLLANAGIAAVAYKGPVLAQELYGSMALRDVLDLDIVVHKRDALRGRELLLERGYRSGLPTGHSWDWALLATGCNFPLIDEASGFVVELHWTPESCLSEHRLNEFWRRLEYVSLAGTQVPSFGSQDLLVLLCLHGCRHMWERLEWLASVAELLRTAEVSWGEVLQVASSIGARRALFLGAILAHECLGAPVPREILRQAWADAQMHTLVDAACDQLFTDAPVLAHQLGVRFHSFQLRSKERLRDRIVYVGQHALAPSKRRWKSIPPDAREYLQQSSVIRAVL